MYKVLDVSEFQGTINWDDVKKDGYEYVFIRVGGRFYGSGKIFSDSRYKENLDGATKHGFKIGVYFYTQAITEAEAIEEAEFTLKLIKGYNIELPVVIDTEINNPKEERLNTITSEKRTLCAIAFMEHVKKAGYTPMFYCGYYYLRDYLNADKLQNYHFWLAQYTTASVPTCSRNYDIWQYSSKGNINGISGNVDVNRGYTNFIKRPDPWTLYKDETKIKAVDVLLGRYGNGRDRVKNLGASYKEVQTLVNKLVDLFI